MKNTKILSSLISKFAERILVKILGLVVSIVLARLLLPEDFGNIAILMVFVNLATMIVQSGLNTALVQKKEVDYIDFSVVFFISLFIAIIMVVLLYFVAPLIARFYESNVIILPLRVYSLVLIFGAFNSIQLAKAQREMKFTATMIASIVSTALAATIGIILAYKGFGLWALIIYYSSYTIINIFAMFFVAKWFPKFVFSFSRAKILFAFGSRMLVSGLLCSIFYDIRSLIIGKMFSTTELGYYDKGYQFSSLISHNIDSSVQSVMFPAISSVQDNKQKVIAMVKRSISIGSFILFPIMTGLALISKPLIIVLLTEKWLPSVILMQFLCIGDIFIPITSANLIVIKSLGRSDVYMKLEVVRRIMMIIILIVTIVFFDTLIAIAIGYALSAFLDSILVGIPTKKLLGYGPLSQYKNVWKSFISTGCMALSVYLISLLSISSNLLLIICQVVVGVVSYLLFNLLFKVESLKYCYKMIKGLFKKKNTN